MQQENKYVVQLKILPAHTDGTPGFRPKEIHRLHFGTLDEAFHKLNNLPKEYFQPEQVTKHGLTGLIQHASITREHSHKPVIQLLNFFRPTDKSSNGFTDTPGQVLYFLKDNIAQELTPSLQRDLAIHSSFTTEHYVPKNVISLPPILKTEVASTKNQDTLYNFPGYLFAIDITSKVFHCDGPQNEARGIIIRDISPSSEMRIAIEALLRVDVNAVDPLLAHNNGKDFCQMSASVKTLEDNLDIVKLVNVRYEGVRPEMKEAGYYIEYASRIHRALAEIAVPELKQLNMPEGSLAAPLAKYKIDPTMRAEPTHAFQQLKAQIEPSIGKQERIRQHPSREVLEDLPGRQRVKI